MLRKLNALNSVILFALLISVSAWAAPRQHAITFGQWMKVKLFIGPEENKVEDMKVRTLVVDGRIREFVTGDLHDVTDRIFVARRAYRLNDALPEDGKLRPEWKWQRGGWVMVDRSTGRVSQLNLPDFDPFFSTTSWYRDYVAYCGISGGADRLYAVVYQLGFRKPVLHEAIGKANLGDMPDAVCGAPAWQKQPARVTFDPRGSQKVSFTIHGHASELQPAQADEEESSQPQSQ
ncbi:MAG TPA: hypothetical protein VF493_19925 [Terriglobales bacterium]